MRARFAVAACALVAACGGGGGAGGPPAVLGPAGPKLAPPPAIDASARGAAYLTAIAEQVQPAWSQFLEDCRLRLPKAHPLNAEGLAATADLAIARDGRILRLSLSQPSGSADFDGAAQQVLADAAPLPRPPIELESDDEAVHVRWLLARDRRQAGAATAQVLTVQLPLLGVVERLLARGALARAAHRILQGPGAAGSSGGAYNDMAQRVTATELVMIAALREALASSDGGARRAAVEAVGRAAVQPLAEPLHALLVATVDGDLRLAAAAATASLAAAAAAADAAADEAAGARRGAAAAALLVGYRDDLASRPRLALEKTGALVRLGHAADVTAALRAELEEREAPQPGAGRTGPPPPPPPAAALAALALAPDPELAPKLPGWFQRGDARVRAGICAALPAAAPALAAQLVERGLRDADAMVRAACAEAAAGTAAPTPRAPAAPHPIVRRLRELARDRDQLVRARAVAALSVLDPASREPAFRPRAAEDPAAPVRAAAVATATAAELRALAADRDAEVRAAAISHLGDPELAARAAADGAAAVRRAAVAALSDDAALEALSRDDSPEVAVAAHVRLAARRGRAAMAVPSLQRLIAAPSGSAERVRIALAWLLAR